MSIPAASEAVSALLRRDRARRHGTDPLVGMGGLAWRAKDLELIDRLIAERRNVLICGGGLTGKSAAAALLAGRIAAARPAERVLCVLERYPQSVIGDSPGIVPDPGALKLLAMLRRGAYPPCGSLIFDEIYTSSGAHSVLEAWHRGIMAVGTVAVAHPEQGDCLGRIALLETAYPNGFSREQVVEMYRTARPVIVRAVRPGVIEVGGDVTPIPSWMSE
jgi:hypothetical protein